ncbi:MAG: RepB family protein, partial [Waterburya sp.]
MKEEIKKLGTRITTEHKEKLLNLCNSNSLNQGEMIQKLIDFYLAKSSLSTDSTNKTSLIQQLELNEIEA